MEAVDLLVDSIQKLTPHLSKSRVKGLIPNYIFNGEDLRDTANIQKYAEVIASDINLVLPNSSSPVASGKLIDEASLFYQTNYIFDFGYDLFDFNNKYFNDYFNESFGGSKQIPLPLYFKTFSNSSIGFGGNTDLQISRKVKVSINDNLKPIQNRNVIYDLNKPAGNFNGHGISIDFSIPKKYKNSFIGEITFVDIGGTQTNKLNYFGDLEDLIQSNFTIKSEALTTPAIIKNVERGQNNLILTLDKGYDYDSSIRAIATIESNSKQKIQFSLGMNADSNLKSDSKQLRVFVLDVLENQKIDTGIVLINSLPNTKIVFNGSFTPSFSRLYRLIIEITDETEASYKATFSDFSIKGSKLTINDSSTSGDEDDAYFIKSEILTRNRSEEVKAELKKEIYPITNINDKTAFEIKEEIEAFVNKAKIAPSRFVATGSNKSTAWRSTGLARFVGSSNLIKTIVALTTVRTKLQSIVSALETARQIANVLSQIEELATDPLSALGRTLITEFKELVNSAKTSGIYLLDLSEITCGTVGKPLGVRYFFEDGTLREKLARNKNSNIVTYQLNQQNSDVGYLSQTTPSERAQNRKDNKTENAEKKVDGELFQKGKEFVQLIPYFHAPMTFNDLIDKIADAFIDPYDRPDASVLDGVVTWRSESPTDAPTPFFAPQSVFGLNLRGTTPLPGSAELKPRPFTFRSGAPKWGRGTTATVHLLIYSAPNLTLFLNMHKRFQVIFNGKSYSDPAYKLWDSYISFYENLKERFGLPDYNPSNIMRDVEEFNKIHSPSGGGNLPDFYGINLYSLMPNVFTQLDFFVKRLESYLTFANDSLSEVIRETINTIQKGIDGILNIINLIDDIIEFLETLLLIQFSILTINSTDGVYDIREKIINAEGFPAQITDPNGLSDAIKNALENGLDVPSGTGASEEILNSLSKKVDGKNAQNIPDIRDKQMWFGGIVIGYGILNDVSVYSESIKKNFENLSQEWDESKGELKQNLQNIKNNSETDSFVRRLIR